MPLLALLFLDICFLYFSYFIFMWCCFIFIILPYDIPLSCNVTIWTRTCLFGLYISPHKTQFISTLNSWANSSWYEYQLLLRYFFFDKSKLFIYFLIFSYFSSLSVSYLQCTTSKLNLESFNIDKSHRFLLRVLFIVNVCTQYLTKYIILHLVQVVWYFISEVFDNYVK